MNELKNAAPSFHRKDSSLVLAHILFVCSAGGESCRAPKGYTEYPIGEVMETAEQTPRILERWGVWVGILVVQILVAYTVPVTEIINDPSPGSKGFVTW